MVTCYSIVLPQIILVFYFVGILDLGPILLLYAESSQNGGSNPELKFQRFPGFTFNFIA